MTSLLERARHLQQQAQRMHAAGYSLGERRRYLRKRARSLPRPVPAYLVDSIAIDPWQNLVLKQLG